MPMMSCMHTPFFLKNVSLSWSPEFTISYLISKTSEHMAAALLFVMEVPYHLPSFFHRYSDSVFPAFTEVVSYDRKMDMSQLNGT